MGLGRVARLRHVTLALVRNTALSALAMGVARASGEVGITLMLGGNIAGKTATLSLEIYNAVSRGDFTLASALSALLAAIVLLLYIAFEALRARHTL